MCGCRFNSPPRFLSTCKPSPVQSIKPVWECSSSIFRQIYTTGRTEAGLSDHTVPQECPSCSVCVCVRDTRLCEVDPQPLVSHSFSCAVVSLPSWHGGLDIIRPPFFFFLSEINVLLLKTHKPSSKNTQIYCSKGRIYSFFFSPPSLLHLTPRNVGYFHWAFCACQLVVAPGKVSAHFGDVNTRTRVCFKSVLGYSVFATLMSDVLNN